MVREAFGNGQLNVTRSPLALFGLTSAGGIAGLLVFWYRLFEPVEFDAFSLPVVALVGGIAATFNPCALPALPGFLAGGGRTPSAGGRRVSALAASAGAATIALVFGAAVAIFGATAEAVLEPPVHGVQLTLGLAIAALAFLHIVDRADVIPLVRRLSGVGTRLWDAAMRRPSRRASYVFGGAFLAVGAT
jgi:cytochrome c biogenesis protein CcdA